jgi:Short C-terminal domain/Phospholipase_D-nuclease N-terminal
MVGRYGGSGSARRRMLEPQTERNPMVIADYSLGDALLTVLEIFLLVIWFWILITIFADLFRDHQLSGWAKAAWVLFLIIAPFLGALVYLIARGQGMRDRSVKEQADARRHFDQYVRETAGTSPVDELHKLSDLKDKGAISQEEYDRMKEKIVA